jgi:hypothetical protein
MEKSPVPQLDDLISSIQGTVTDPLQQLTAAVLVAQTLDDLADHLIGHFVDQARQAGASWANIGQSLGVTKQAAQKRFVPGEPETAVFARYTEAARKAIIGAQTEAQQRGAAEIRPGHMLLALLEDQETHQLLGDLDTEAVRAAVSDVVGSGAGVREDAIPFSPASKKALELGHREAVRRHDEHIDPKHILLGVLAMTDEPDIAAGTALGLTRERVEATVPA